jgi:sulfoxide reductase catalytic subunit YedY
MNTPKFKSVPIKPSEITPEHLYRSRRAFLKSLGLVGAGALLAACGVAGSSNLESTPTDQPTVSQPGDLSTNASVDELGDPINTYETITNYNNFYEFTTDKGGVAKLAKDFKPSRGENLYPWELQVYGLVNNPVTYDLEDILNKFTQEERIYRLRCVEGWSLVIPWTGFQLSELLKEADPQSGAKYVRFETLDDPSQMPGVNRRGFPWPYQEGLRLDEAMNRLTLLVTGLYGKELPAQNGSPLRLAVPWKYGFKSIKSIIKIELVADKPATMWSTIAPNEYGFYANVNPNVPHPRWSQASERRLGEAGRRPTLMFNGYEEEVASLYEGMDLKAYY